MLAKAVNVHRRNPVAAAPAENRQGHKSRTAEGHQGVKESESALTRIGTFWSSFALGGSIDPFMSSGQHMAAAAWTRAIARHGTIPAVDIFVPLPGIQGCREQFFQMPSHVYGASTAVTEFFPASDLPACFQAHVYDALHLPGGIDFGRLTYLRSRLTQNLFPVTCSAHGLSYSSDVPLCFISLLTAQIYPCDAIVCSTLSSRKALEKRLSDIAERYSRAWDRSAPLLPRLELIPWGIDTEQFAPRDRDTARRDLNLPPDRIILLCVGRLRIHDKMDLTPLLLAFDRVVRSLKRSQEAPPLLVLAGANPTDYGHYVMAQAADLGLAAHVKAFFNLPSACLPSLYAACDIFVSPTDSLTESFSLTIVEAMASARPVVASDWDGYKELIVHGRTGFKVRTDWADCLGEMNIMAPFLDWEQDHLHAGQSVNVDVGEIAGYLTELIRNRDLREEMGRQARAVAEARYRWPVIISQWETLWSELKTIAATLDRKVADKLDYLQPNYFQHFCHYSSRIIDDTIPVRLTERGQSVLKGKEHLRLHPWTQGFLKPELLHDVLLAVKSSRWFSRKVVIGELISMLGAVHKLSRDQALMHLMWLAKYDLLTFDGDEAVNRSFDKSERMMVPA